MALAPPASPSPSSSVVDNFSGSPLSRNEGSLRSDAEDRPVKKSRIEVDDGKENHPQPSKKIRRVADNTSSCTPRKKTKQCLPSSSSICNPSSFDAKSAAAAAAAAKNDNRDAPKSPSTKSQKKTEADDDDDWVHPVDTDCSDDELSHGSGRSDASERIKIEDDLSLSDDELSDDDALSETERELREYVQDTVTVGLPTTIAVHHPQRRKWSRLQKVKRIVVNVIKSLAHSVLPESLFYNEENEKDNDDQSTDSLNYYAKHSCPGSGLDETTLSEMRERPAVSLCRGEQLGAQLGLFKDGKPMRVTEQTAENTLSRSKFGFALYYDESAGKVFHDMKEAMKYCGVDRINLPHPQVNKDLVPRIGYNPDQVAAVYRSSNRMSYSIYTHAGDYTNGCMAIDVLENGDDSEDVLAMAGSIKDIMRFIGGESIKAKLQLLENGSHTSVNIRNFTLRIHSPQVSFVPGIVSGKEEKLNSLKSINASGKYTLFQDSMVDKPYWERVDAYRIRTHAQSTRELSRIMEVDRRKLKAVSTMSSGEHYTHTTSDGVETEIHHYDEEEESHGTDFESYETKKKAAASTKKSAAASTKTKKSAAASTKTKKSAAASTNTKKKAAASTKKSAAASTKTKKKAAASTKTKKSAAASTKKSAAASTKKSAAASTKTKGSESEEEWTPECE